MVEVNSLKSLWEGLSIRILKALDKLLCLKGVHFQGPVQFTKRLRGIAEKKLCRI